MPLLVFTPSRRCRRPSVRWSKTPPCDSGAENIVSDNHGRAVNSTSRRASVSTLNKPNDPLTSEAGTKPRKIPGEGGLWVLLFGDMALFTLLLGMYVNRRDANKLEFAASQDHLNRSLGWANTLILLTSSILVVFAFRALRNERTRSVAPWLTAAAIAVGLCFVGTKTFEYYQSGIAGITPNDTPFWMWYYAITGLHLAHVVLGLFVLIVLCHFISMPRLTANRVQFFEGGACFWHMVDLLWIIIFPVIYLVR